VATPGHVNGPAGRVDVLGLSVNRQILETSVEGFRKLEFGKNKTIFLKNIKLKPLIWQWGCFILTTFNVDGH
jgi:hypothetical protein